MENNDRGNTNLSRREFLLIACVAALSTDQGVAQFAKEARHVYVVPNFHPASCGWLATFSMERVYCANSYFDHLDRVRDDPDYAFVLSEVNNMIAMLNFKPERMPELKSRIHEGRVELVNGFFLESSINLSGGEALVRLGVEGLRWQRKMFGVRPRFAWTIDACGTHDQMAQIASGLGLEAMVYTRKNPTGSAVHWSVSPDGSKVLSLSPGAYSELQPVMRTEQPLTPAQLDEVEKLIDGKRKITPENAPILILAGSHDYALAPSYKHYPREFLRQWNQKPDRPEVRFSILSNYLNELQELDRGGRLKIPTMLGGTAYDFDAFWIECPRVKSSFRKCEHLLRTAESLATLASLKGDHAYPSQELYNAWTLLFLSMDRNTLWGSAGGMVFESRNSWDASDRLDWIENHSSSAAAEAGMALIPVGEDIAIYNPLNWSRRDPVLLPHALDGRPGQRLGGEVLCQPEIPSLGLVGLKRAISPAAEAEEVPLPPSIKTKQYELKINPKTGAIDSIKLRASDKEVLAAPANVVVAEKPKTQKGDPGDFMAPRPQRDRLDSTSKHPQKIHVLRGPVATIVTIEGEFIGGGLCRRTVTLFDDYPRIDLTTELNDLPNLTVVVAEFPLAGAVDEVRRGIPYGFSHGAWDKPNPDLHGWTKGIVPSVRWSHYLLSSGCGVALLDKGLTGREINESTPIIYLYNATEKYYEFPNPWLSGKGPHVLEYALVAHDGNWREARIPHLAWEFNSPPVAISGRAVVPESSHLKTSPNIVVEGLRRVADDIELRFVECLGHPGTAEITLSLPHSSATRTDMNGEHGKPLTGGPTYWLPVRPQEIVTLRFRTDTRIAEPELVTKWDAMVPPAKLPMLYRYSNEKGLPPKGDGTPLNQ